MNNLVSKQAVLNALDSNKYSNEFCEEHNIDWSINLGMAHIAVNELETADDKLIDAIDFAIEATGSQDDYCTGMRNGMRYVKYLINGKEPQYELRWHGIDLGDEVIGDYGKKGVVVGINIYKGEVMLSLLMKDYNVPQLVKASNYKTKTGRHFPQITEVLEQIKGEEDGK